jgi:hypothetical protein
MSTNPVPGPRYTIHADAAKKQSLINISVPQEAVPATLPPNFATTHTKGIPVKLIPAYKFPLIVYMHPNEPYETIEHRNERFEVVGEEVVPTSHLSKSIHCEAHADGAVACDACEALLQAALDDGWQLEQYIPKAPPKRNAGLYGPKKNTAKKQA